MSLAKKVILGSVVLVVAAAAAAGLSAKLYLGHDRIVRGVHVQKEQLGDLTKPAALEVLKRLDQEISRQSVVVEASGKQWQVTLGELGVKLNTEEMLAAAYSAGRNGSLLEQYQERKQIETHGREISLKASINRSVMEKKLTEVSKEVSLQPVDAVLQIAADDQVRIIPGKNGLGVDTSLAAEDLTAIVEKSAEPKLVLNLKEIPPKQSEADLRAMRIKGVVAVFSTIFDASQSNRSYNIVVAAGALNGLLVKPGETVSFNKIVGPRSSAAGYREAPVIVNNKLVPGIGGGVCQVSTTLYNSLLKGDFQIVFRRPHSFPSSYVPIGRDATVTYGGIDFKFRNNRTGYLYIKSVVQGNRLTFKLFGDPAENKEVEISDQIELVIPNKTVYVKDPNLEQGKQVVKEKGHRGYRTSTIRLVKQNGRVVTREVVAKSYYKPVTKVIAVGTGAPAVMRPQPANPDGYPGGNQSPTAQPAEAQPAETQPVETQPADTQPAGTQPADTQPSPIDNGAAVPVN